MRKRKPGRGSPHLDREGLVWRPEAVPPGRVRFGCNSRCDPFLVVGWAYRPGGFSSAPRAGGWSGGLEEGGISLFIPGEIGPFGEEIIEGASPRFASRGHASQCRTGGNTRAYPLPSSMASSRAVRVRSTR